MSILARLLLVTGLLIPLAACNKKKKHNDDNGPHGLPGLEMPVRLGEVPEAQGLESLRAERILPPFTGIDIALDADTVVTAGSKHSVKVEAPDDLLPRIRTEVLGGRLVIGLGENVNLAGLPKARITVVAARIDWADVSFGRIQIAKMTGDKVHVEAFVGSVTSAEVYAKQLTVKLSDSQANLTGKVDAATVDVNDGTANLKGTYGQVKVKTGGGKVVMDGKVTGLSGTINGEGNLAASGEFGNASLVVEGSGTASLNAKMGYLRANLAGSGEMTARGTAKSVLAEVVGGSKLTAHELQAETVQITARNGTNSTVWPTKTLTAIIDSGGGTIRYKGNPRIDRRVGSGGGQVLPLGEK